MSTESKKISLKERAYNIIKEKILMCEYPPNMLLNEEVLREEVQASRTPVRDALSRLEQENLVTILPKKGVIVAPLSIREINIIHESRMLVEPYAVEQYGHKVPKEKYLYYANIFRKILEQDENSSERYIYDDEFHHEIIEATGNHYLIELYEKVCQQNRRLRILSGNGSKNRMCETQKEHLRIINACLEEEWQTAAEAMRNHIKLAKQASFEVILNDNTFEF